MSRRNYRHLNELFIKDNSKETFSNFGVAGKPASGTFAPNPYTSTPVDVKPKTFTDVNSVKPIVTESFKNTGTYTDTPIVNKPIITSPSTNPTPAVVTPTPVEITQPRPTVVSTNSTGTSTITQPNGQTVIVTPTQPVPEYLSSGNTMPLGIGNGTSGGSQSGGGSDVKTKKDWLPILSIAVGTLILLVKPLK